MKKRRQMQAAIAEIVRLKAVLKQNQDKLKMAYFDYYIACGLSADQADKLVF